MPSGKKKEVSAVYDRKTSAPHDKLAKSYTLTRTPAGS